MINNALRLVRKWTRERDLFDELSRIERFLTTEQIDSITLFTQIDHIEDDFLSNNTSRSTLLQSSAFLTVSFPLNIELASFVLRLQQQIKTIPVEWSVSLLFSHLFLRTITRLTLMKWIPSETKNPIWKGNSVKELVDFSVLLVRRWCWQKFRSIAKWTWREAWRRKELKPSKTSVNANCRWTEREREHLDKSLEEDEENKRQRSETANRLRSLLVTRRGWEKIFAFRRFW